MGVGMLWNAAGSTVYFVCQWLLGILAVRLSGYADAGDLSLAMSISNVISTLALYGVRNYQVADIHNRIPNGVYVSTRIITSGAAYVATIILIAYSHYPPKTNAAVLLYCLFRMTEAAVDVLHGIDQKSNRLDAVGKSFLFRGVAFLTAFWVTMRLTHNVIWAIIMMTVAVLPVVLWFDYPITDSISCLTPQWSHKDIFRLLKDSTPLVCYLLLMAATATLPRYFLERLYGNEILGIYSSVSAPTIIIQVAATYMFNPLVPIFSKYYMEKNKKEFHQLFLKVTALILILSAGAILAGSLLGKFGLSLLFGAEILSYYDLLSPAILNTSITAWVWFLCAALTVMHENRGLILANITALAACLICSPLLIQRFGVQGTNYSNILAVSLEGTVLFLYFMINDRTHFTKGDGAYV